MRTILLLVPLGALIAFGCSPAPGPPFKPVADVQQLMEMMVDPAADVVWDAVGTVITAAETNEWFPQTDEEWATVRNSAVVLMESGNLLMMGSRARDQDAWMRMAQGLVDAGALAMEAAESKDPDAVFAVGEDVYIACDRCHNLYWVGDEDRRPVLGNSPEPPSR